jgi:hypothetical protein
VKSQTCEIRSALFIRSQSQEMENAVASRLRQSKNSIRARISSTGAPFESRMSTLWRMLSRSGTHPEIMITGRLEL